MNKRKSQQKYLIVAGIFALAVVVAIAVYAMQPKSKPTDVNVTPTGKGPQSDTTADTPTPTSTPTNTNPLPAPTGSFLSSAKISLGGSEESTCATEHGTTCYLIIKNPAGIEIGRILIPEVDGGGGHLVVWPVNKYISATGKFTVSALATDGARSSTSNSYPLEVTP